jgi:hypothetical protein
MRNCFSSSDVVYLKVTKERGGFFMAKDIRMVGGAWRVIDGQNISSYTTYADALAGGQTLEDQEPVMTSDDINAQLFGGGSAGKK